MVDEVSLEIEIRRVAESLHHIADLLAGKPVERELHEGEILRKEYDDETNESFQCLTGFHDFCRGEYALHECTCACHAEGIEDD